MFEHSSSPEMKQHALKSSPNRYHGPPQRYLYQPRLLNANQVTGKVVLITGSSSGIGRACALEAARQGARGIGLHYLGDNKTYTDVSTLQSEISNLQYPEGREKTKTIILSGDISIPETSERCVKACVQAFDRIGAAWTCIERFYMTSA